MRRVIGFALFFISLGMLIMMFLHSSFVGLIILLIFMLLGYNLFCN